MGPQNKEETLIACQGRPQHCELSFGTLVILTPGTLLYKGPPDSPSKHKFLVCSLPILHCLL